MEPTLGVIHMVNDVTAFGGRRYQRFCDGSTEALVLNRVTMDGEGVMKFFEIYVTSFMDDLLV